MNGRSLSLPAAGGIPGQEISAVDLDSVAVSGAAALRAPAIAAELRAGRLSLSTYQTFKRAFDIVGSLIALIVLSPFLAAFALIIKCQDGGPALYKQTRVGKNERHFAFYKFRSMIRDADRLKDQLASLNGHSDPRTFKIK